MNELSQWLREAREARGLTLAQAETQTRIRSKFLSALEEGLYDDLPAEVYTRGFLRNYALFLGLDPAEALEKYQKRDAGEQSGEPGLFRPLEVMLFQARKRRLRSGLVILILVAGLCLAGLWAWRTGRLAWPPRLALFQPTATATATAEPTRTSLAGPTALPTVAAVATAKPSPSAAATDNGPSRTTPTPLPTPTVTPTADIAASPSPITSPTLVAGEGIVLQLTVTEQCWVEVTLDGINNFRGMLNTGDEQSWQARREIILLMGNAGGVQVTVNGQFLGALGERQQVVEFAWGPEGQVTPAPTATASPPGPVETRTSPTP